MDRSVLVLDDRVHELFTGIDTDFVTDVGLEKGAAYSEAEDEYPSRLDPAARGDAVLHYVDREGRPRKGFVCDSGWSLEDAEVLCQEKGHESGMPTYEGRFSGGSGGGGGGGGGEGFLAATSAAHRSGWFAVSEVTCKSGESRIQDCDYKRARSRRTHLVQKSLDGVTHLCSQPGERAGVICGRGVDIIKLKKPAMDCANVGTSASDVFSLKQQVQKVMSEMNANKHWAEYILPIPYLVSLITTVMLQSAQFDMTVLLVKPEGGRYKHLRWNTYKANVAQFGFNVTGSFKLSNKNMNRIKSNCRIVHKYLFEAVKDSFSPDPFFHKTMLKRHLAEVSVAANDSYLKAKEIEKAFEDTEELLKELVEAVIATEDYHGRSTDELKRELEILNNQTRKNAQEIEQRTKEKTEFFRKIEESVEKFQAAAQKAMSQECVKGIKICKNCVHQEQKQLGSCRVPKEKVCIKYEDKCKSTTHKGRFWFIKWGSKCASHASECVDEQLQCPQFEHRPAGKYCVEGGKKSGPPCGPCNHAKAIQNTVDKIFKQFTDLQTSYTSTDAINYVIIRDQVQLVIESLDGIVVDVNSFKSSTDSGGRPKIRLSVRRPRSASEEEAEQEEAEQEEAEQEEAEQEKAGQEEAEQEEMDSKAQNATQGDTTGKGAEDRNIKSKVDMLDSSAGMLDILISDDFAQERDLRAWAKLVQGIAERLRNADVKKTSMVTPSEVKRLAKALKDGHKLHQHLEAKARQGQARIKTQERRDAPEGAGGEAADGGGDTGLPVYSEARAIMLNEVSYAKTTRRLEELEVQQRRNLNEILQKDVARMTLAEVVQFLRDMARQMAFMKKSWGQISLFFQKLAEMMENSKKNVR